MFQKITSKSSPDEAPASPPRPQSPPQAAPQQSAAPAAAPSSAAATAGGQRNILSNDVHINGSVRFTNDLLVDGRIEGKISSDGALTVAENAHIKAEIKTKSVVIYGKVHGNIICTESIEIKGSAEMVGDVKAGSLSIEPGAIFVGKSDVGTPSAQPKSQGSPAASAAPQQQQQGNSKKPQGAQK